MIQIRSWVEVADNSGAKRATMIGVIGKKSLEAGIGDIITANVKEAAHDAEGAAKEGDRVLIRETRPLSRLKRWELVEILKQQH